MKTITYIKNKILNHPLRLVLIITSILLIAIFWNVQIMNLPSIGPVTLGYFILLILGFIPGFRDIRYA